MNEPTLDQKRARHAFALVQKARLDQADLKVFKTQVKKLPARIIASGLGQALAFLEAKRYAPHLRCGLSQWIKECGTVGEAPDDDRLLIRLIAADNTFLRFATAECLAYLQWLGRFTDAELRDIPDQDQE
ncbi:MAG: type III-B CRISPR module-associated protein Cmr5 [Isosphaeraceae bacterium]